MSARSISVAPTLYEVLAPAGQMPTRLLQSIVVVVVGSLLLTLSAKVQIPMWPVPITLQTLVVLCLGIVLGPTLGAAAVLLYLGQGAMGLPVFAGTPEKGIGLAYMVGPTGGYLFGFLAAAYVTGLLAKAKWDRNVITMVLAMVVGNLVIYACGVAHLSTFVGSIGKAIQLGVMPFLAGDVVKIIIAALIIPGVWRLCGNKASGSQQ